MTKIQHLTEDDLTNYLIDPASEDAATMHLADCAACTAKLAAFRVSMESFSMLSLAWSEQRSITTPLRPTRSRAVRWIPNTMPGWSAAIAAALLLAIAVPMDLHVKARQSSAELRGDAGVDQDSEAQIQRDNQLMRAVSLEINRREPSPLVALNEPAQANSSAKRRSDVSSE
jgi:hypothetical protein